MAVSIRQSIRLNLVSPIGLAAISYTLFLVAWTFPPDLYSRYVSEPNYMFLDPTTLFFVTLCTGAFMLGAYATGRKGNRDDIVVKPLISSAPLRTLCAPLLIFSVYSLLYLRALNGNINVFGLLAASQGQAIKDIVQGSGLSQGVWDYGINLLIASIWWASIRVQQVALTRPQKITFNIIFWTAAAIALTTCVARADRTTLTAFVAGLGICITFRKIRLQGSSLWQVFLIVAWTLVVILGFFLLLSVLRGFGSGQLLIFALLGYSIVSYNRLAALLLGVMHYTYQGAGVYLASYLAQISKSSVLSFIPETLGFPDAASIWRSEFLSVQGAGLFIGFNWSSTFGYVFSDMGWASPFYFFLTGLLCGRAWTWFVGRRLLGLILYPWFGFWILFWLGWNCIFDYEVVALLEGVALLAAYEWFFFQTKAPDPLPVGAIRSGQQGPSIA